MTILTQETGQFSGYTLAQMRALVLKRLRANDTVRYSVDGDSDNYDWIDDALNRAQEKFSRKTKFLKTYGIIELQANQRTYRLPTDFIDLDAAYYYDSSLSNGYSELVVKTSDEISKECADFRTATGTPKYIYLDRIYGNTWTAGFYYIPSVDGDTITFDTDYGSVVQWVCPLYTPNSEYGTVIRMSDSDEFFLPSNLGIVADIVSVNKNVWIDYFRLARTLENESQYSEIPREYQIGIIDDAAADLLDSEPEDSAEFKRSMRLAQKSDQNIKDYIGERKDLIGQNRRMIPSQWNWMKNMDFYRNVP
jgi:hypothetical protein